MGTLDIPASVVALNGMTAVGSDPISTDDGDTSYVHFQGFATGGFQGYNLDVNFPATALPGPLLTTSLVTVAKGTDSRQGGGFGARLILTDGAPSFTTHTWYPIIPLSTSVWTETVTPLTESGVEYVTQARIEAGTVEYNPGYALLNDGSSGVAWHTYLTYVALRVTYAEPSQAILNPSPAHLRVHPREDASARRLWPPPRSRQGSNRLNGYL